MKNTPVRSSRAIIKTDKTPRVSNHRNSSSRTPNSKQPSSSAKKQRTPSRPRDTSRGRASRSRASSSRRTGSPKVPISLPTGATVVAVVVCSSSGWKTTRAATRAAATAAPTELQQRHLKSYSSGTYSKDELSYYSDTEMEDADNERRGSVKQCVGISSWRSLEAHGLLKWIEEDDAAPTGQF